MPCPDALCFPTDFPSAHDPTRSSQACSRYKLHHQLTRIGSQSFFCASHRPRHNTRERRFIPRWLPAGRTRDGPFVCRHSCMSRRTLTLKGRGGARKKEYLAKPGSICAGQVKIGVGVTRPKQGPRRLPHPCRPPAPSSARSKAQKPFLLSIRAKFLALSRGVTSGRKMEGKSLTTIQTYPRHQFVDRNILRSVNKTLLD